MFSTGELTAYARRLAATAVHRSWAAFCRLGAIVPGDDQARLFGRFGPSSCIAFPQGAMFGLQWIHIGEGTLIGPHVTLSAGMAPGQQMVTNPVVRVGDRCLIGRGSSIVGHLSIEIGDDVWTGPYVYITDQNHSYADPDVPIGRQMPRNAPVRIGPGSWLGTGAVVLPGACIGRNVVIAAGSVVRGTVPDHCVVAGVPARVVRAYVPDVGWQPLHPPASPAPPPSASPAGFPAPPPSAVPAAGFASPPPSAAAAAERVEGVAQPTDPPG